MSAHRWVPALLALAGIVAVLAACGSSGSSQSRASASPFVAKDVAAAAGAQVARATHTHGEDCVADIDGDGKTDLILSTHDTSTPPPAWPLMLGEGNGKFRFDDKFILKPLDRHGCAVADFNHDGLLDIYLSRGACKGLCQSPKELWIQQKDHSFINEAPQWGISDPGGRGRVPLVVNANGDDLPDLFTGQELGVKYPSFNRLWINKGDHFELQEGPITNQNGNLCAAAADIDGNGLDDIAVCTPTKGFFLYRDEGGKYVLDTKSFGVAPYGRITVKFPDLNGDHRPDFVTVTRTQVQVFLNQHGRYPRAAWSLPVTDGRDVAFGDINGDGRPDMYVQQGTFRDQVFLNEAHGTRWVPGPKLPAKKGVGDTEVPIPDWKGTHRVAFLVNNGFQFNTLGPRQLIEFDRR